MMVGESDMLKVNFLFPLSLIPLFYPSNGYNKFDKMLVVTIQRMLNADLSAV